MFRLHFVTTNQGKIESMKRSLDGLPVELVPVAIDIPEVRSDETSEIAIGKAKYAFEMLK